MSDEWIAIEGLCFHKLIFAFLGEVSSFLFIHACFFLSLLPAPSSSIRLIHNSLGVRFSCRHAPTHVLALILYFRTTLYMPSPLVSLLSYTGIFFNNDSISSRCFHCYFEQPPFLVLLGDISLD